VFKPGAKPNAGVVPRALATALAALVLAIAASACGSSSDSGDSKPAASDGGGEPAKVSVRLDYFAGPEQAGFWMAKDLGLYDKAGIDVKVNEGQGSDTTAQIVAAGKEVFGFVSGDALVRANAQGGDLVMVSMPIQDPGFSVAVREDSGITSIEQLEGKTYTDSAGSIALPLFKAVCAASDADCGKIKVATVPYQALIPGFLSGKLEAIEANDYLEPLYAKSGPVRFLRFRDNGVPTLGWGIVVKRETLEKRRALVKSFVEATMAGFDEAFADPKAYYETVSSMVRKYTQDEETDVFAMKAFQRHTPNTEGKPDGWMAVEDFQNSIDILTKYSGLKDAPDPSSLFTNEFVGGD
jgi:NitT/TauT family transport system substrate-binding protein